MAETDEDQNPSANQIDEFDPGARGGSVTPQDWGAVTTKGNKIYVHLLDLKSNTLSLPLTEKIKSARYLKDRVKVEFEATSNGVTLKNLRPQASDEYDSIIVLEKK